ncbi:MAG: radical SAM protein [Planctomycetota bacterium]
MDTLLLHPPFADPTQPYLSLPTLKGFLRARGLDAQVADLNIEALHYLLRRDRVQEVACTLGRRFLELNTRPALGLLEQMEYLALAKARPWAEEMLGAEPSPVEVLQGAELFYDPAAYSLARRRVEGFFEALSAAHFPYRFHFNHVAHRLLPWGFDLLESYATEEKSPLIGFYREVFDGPAHGHPESVDVADWEALETAPLFLDVADSSFIGISIVFPSQIPEAFHLARLLRRRAPRAFLAFGGPCIHQIVFHLEELRRRRVLDVVDGVCLFEGEEALARLLERLREWREAPNVGLRFEALRDLPNWLLLDRAQGKSVTGPRHELDLTDAPPPDYTDLDLDRYLAPSRTLLYAPTRGCYWNRCSFCYYGLSETATARYREVPAAKAAADLAKLSRRHGVKNFYISCDVLSPRYALELARALTDRGIKIRWSCDLKIERSYTPERCELLFRSGLRAVAFGVESGSDRLLELIRKGCDRATMTRVNRAFHDAGIATQWMAFTGHPTETVEEALETVNWIAAESDRIDLFIVGEFGLEAGSHIALHPELYGVDRVYYAEGDELRLYALFSQESAALLPEDRERTDAAIERLAVRYALKPYPWAGAISTHHSFLHFLRFGPRVFRTHFQRAQAAFKGELPPPPLSHLAGLRTKPRFSLAEIREREQRFLAEHVVHSLYTTLPERRSDTATGVAALTREHLETLLSASAPLRPRSHSH